MLSPGAMRVLRDLVEDEDCDLVTEGREVWWGDRQTNWRVLRQLLDCVAVSVKDGSFGKPGAVYLGINGVGRAIVRRPELADEVYIAVRTRPFTVDSNDRIVYLGKPKRRKHATRTNPGSKSNHRRQ